MIYNPQEEFDTKFKNLHLDNTNKFFDSLVAESGVDIEANRKTVAEYDAHIENIKKLKKKLNLWRFLRVLMIITLILIPLVILKITPKIRALRSEIEEADNKADALLALAHEQMAPLCALFTNRQSLEIIESTVPDLVFAPSFTAEQEENMIVNFDFERGGDTEISTIDLLSGSYNENPFLFETQLIHTMGMETYHGYKTIHWTETYRGSDGKTHTRMRSQTLHASVTKPKPFYSHRVVLNYCAQAGDELSFTRDASRLDFDSEKEVDRYVKRGERNLKRLTDKAIRENDDFTSMSNTDFEVLFDALDRTDEVQFRTLFTPLAQTNMVDLILSKDGYGDDFHFIKRKRTNRIITDHSQNRDLVLPASSYFSHSFDVIKERFVSKNERFFKDVYFDLAPALAIPVYQDRPVHSLEPIPDTPHIYSARECEALANCVDKERVVHPSSKTEAILKASAVRSSDSIDEICVSAYSYDTIPQVDFVPVFGGDGHMHSVAVPWDEYIPLVESGSFFVTTLDRATDKSALAERNNLCIFN